MLKGLFLAGALVLGFFSYGASAQETVQVSGEINIEVPLSRLVEGSKDPASFIITSGQEEYIGRLTEEQFENPRLQDEWRNRWKCDFVISPTGEMGSTAWDRQTQKPLYNLVTQSNCVSNVK
jgi:hypothetical protein